MTLRIKITYDQLIKKLLFIDFVEKRKTGGRLVFSHLHSDTLVVLPFFKKKEQVPIHIMASIKKTIISKGILSPDQFNDWLSAKM